MNQIGLREYRKRAALLIEGGQLSAALRVTQHILRFFPHSLYGHCLLGHALLGLGRTGEAAEQFSWVLAVDPENVEACIGLITVYQKSGDQQRAIEQLQYAFDLFPADSALRERLNAIADTLAPTQASASIELSRVALARIYARNGLRAKAIQELQAILTQHPRRHDARLALAEALWQEGLQQEAAEESQRVLETLPNALKANLIVAAAWLERAQAEEAQPYLARARALDPEHEMAYTLFGAYSPLPPDNPMLDALEEAADQPSYTGMPIPDGAYVRGIGDSTEAYEKEAIPMGEQYPPEEPFEIPDWLKDLGDELLSEEQEAPEQPTAAFATPAGDAQTELPDWLQSLIARAEASEVEPVTTGETAEELPPWLAEISTEETSAPDLAGETKISEPEELAWPSETAQASEGVPPSDTEAELPEWLRDVAPPSVERTAKETEEALSELPEWLRDEVAADKVAPVQTDELPEWLREETTAAETVPPVTEKTPEWLREEAEPVIPSEAPLPVSEAEQTGESVWLTEEDTTAVPPTSPETPFPAPSEEEAPLPAWLQELRAAEPEPATAQAEGSPTEEEEAQMPEWLRQLRAGIAEAPVLGTRELEEDLAKILTVSSSEVAAPDASKFSPLSSEQLSEEAPTAPLSTPTPTLETPSETPATTGTAEEAVVAPGVKAVPESEPIAEVARESAPLPASETGFEMPSEAETAAEAVAELPEAPAERLALARKAATAGQWSQALRLYASLVDSSEMLSSVISDLEEGIRRHPDDYNGYQLAGDAYAKEGRLAEALRAYRLALAKLQQTPREMLFG
ncbi:MAG: tetratricopeptide repeat protein [Anaerolineae bacterium]